jgi:hypothetical protein
MCDIDDAEAGSDGEPAAAGEPTSQTKHATGATP